MIISDDKKYIFIAVPKTGTSSITDLLLNSDRSAKRNTVSIGEKIIQTNEHITAKNLRNILGDNWKEYYTFGFVRNPLDRLVSFYFFYKEGRVAQRIIEGESVKFRARFHHIMAKYITMFLWRYLYFGKDCSYYLCDENNIIVDKVYSFKNIRTELKGLFNRIGLDESVVDDMKKMNPTEHKHYLEYYGNISRKIIGFKYRRDYKNFSIYF